MPVDSNTRSDSVGSDEAMEGYLDGLDPNSPEPSTNRSAVYRHCFAVGRFDRAGELAFGSAANALRLCEIAEAEDAKRATPPALEERRG